MNELATYSRFHTTEEAEEFAAALADAGISAKIEWEKNILDKVYIGETLDPLFAVRIAPHDFEKANQLQRAEERINVSAIDPEYYLFSFTNEELLDVVRNKGEWNSFDQTLAKQLLDDRKVFVDHNVINKKVEYTPSRVSATVLVLEYLLSIYFPFAGILIGLATLYAFKVLSTGEKVNMYDDSTRMHAKLILAIGIVRVFLIFISIAFIYPF
jgi:hypothetical protein